MKKEIKKIDAIHEDDLLIFLEKFNLAVNFKAGNIKCKFCGTTVNQDNIYSILPELNTVSLICEKPSCVKALLEYLNTKKQVNE